MTFFGSISDVRFLTCFRTIWCSNGLISSSNTRMFTISLRTTTLLIALLGIASQIQILSWSNLVLEALAVEGIPSLSSTLSTSTPIQDQVIPSNEAQEQIPSPSVNKDESLDIEGLDLNTSKGSRIDTYKNQNETHSKSSSSTSYLSWFHSNDNANATSWKLFNVLSNDQIGVEHAQRERKSLDVARASLKLIRAYVVISMMFCVTGIAGVWKSSPLLSRLFVIHSFLDLFLCTASMVSIAILCSYPSIKAFICDFISSGEFNSFFSPSSLNTEESMRNINSGTHADRDPTTGELNIFVVMFDGALSPETCEQSFGSLFVPILLLIALIYTSIRLKMFFTIHSFYNSLLPNKISHSHSKSHHHHHHHHHHRRTKSSSSPAAEKSKNLAIEKQA